MRSLVFLFTSGLLLLQSIQGQGLSSNLELDEEFLEEATADGFIIGVKGTSSNKNDNLTHSYQSTPSSPHQEPSLPTTPHKGHAEADKNPEAFPQNVSDASTVIQSQTTTPSPDENSEGSGDLPETLTPIPLTTTEIIPDLDNSNSRMLPENPNEVQNKNPILSTTARNPQVDIHSSTDVSLLPEVIDGSGMNPEDTTTKGFSAKPTIIVEEILESVEDRVQELEKENPTVISNPETTTKASFRPRLIAPIGSSGLDPEPTISAQAEKGTPDWLIIFAFCLTVGAILCVLAGIATKDKWYGPSRRSLNIEPIVSTEEYGKTATLPLSVKEQQLMTLMSSEKQTEKDFTIISLEEKEKEYLM